MWRSVIKSVTLDAVRSMNRSLSYLIEEFLLTYHIELDRCTVIVTVWTSESSINILAVVYEYPIECVVWSLGTHDCIDENYWTEVAVWGAPWTGSASCHAVFEVCHWCTWFGKHWAGTLLPNPWRSQHRYECRVGMTG